MALHANIIGGAFRSSAIQSFFSLGTHGVDLFFVLSGFLITGILYDDRESAHYFRNFYGRRTLRIFPLYYLFLTISFFILPILQHAPDVAIGRRAWFWLYGSNFIISRIGLFPSSALNINVTWSLAIEEQFYIFWPLIVLYLNARTLRYLCMGIAAACLAFRLFAIHWHFSQIAIYVLTPSRLDTLCLGAWAALVARDQTYLKSKLLRYRTPIGVACFCVAVVCFAPGTWEIAEACGYSAFALSFAALVLNLAIRPQSQASRMLSFRPLRLYGKYSYFLYLFNWPVLRACEWLARAGNLARNSPLLGLRWGAFFVAAMLVPVLPAFLSWHVYEKQFLKLKRYFPHH